jgi:hypothetical protein
MEDASIEAVELKSGAVKILQRGYYGRYLLGFVEKCRLRWPGRSGGRAATWMKRRLTALIRCAFV